MENLLTYAQAQSIVKCLLVWKLCPVVQQNSAPLSFTQLDITEKLLWKCFWLHFLEHCLLWALMSQFASNYIQTPYFVTLSQNPLAVCCAAPSQRNDDPACPVTTGRWQWHHTSCGLLRVCLCSNSDSVKSQIHKEKFQYSFLSLFIISRFS